MKSILDFGAGYQARHSVDLRSQGLDVTSWDFGRNFHPQIHDPAALDRQYDIVMASNVVNVHITPNALRRTLAQIAVATHYTGLALINYPQSPRKLPDLTARHIQDLLVSFFHTVAHVDASCPVWMLSHPREQYAQDVLSITPDFTPAEIDAANIRPSGAVGLNPILPRVLLAIFDR